MSLADESFPKSFFKEKYSSLRAKGPLSCYCVAVVIKASKGKAWVKMTSHPSQHQEFCFLTLYEPLSNSKCYCNLLFLTQQCLHQADIGCEISVKFKTNSNVILLITKWQKNKMSWKILNSENEKGRKRNWKIRITQPSFLYHFILFSFAKHCYT